MPTSPLSVTPTQRACLLWMAGRFAETRRPPVRSERAAASPARRPGRSRQSARPAGGAGCRRIEPSEWPGQSPLPRSSRAGCSCAWPRRVGSPRRWSCASSESSPCWWKSSFAPRISSRPRPTPEPATQTELKPKHNRRWSTGRALAQSGHISANRRTAHVPNPGYGASDRPVLGRAESSMPLLPSRCSVTMLGDGLDASLESLPSSSPTNGRTL